MTFTRTQSLFRAIAPLAALALLAGCENSATSIMIEGKEHALVLVREQSYFWKDDVEQYLVVSRLPECQRRVKIFPNKSQMTPVDVYVAGDRLWALHQGNQWYLASTDKCQSQVWKTPDVQQLGPMVGRFGQRDGKVVFVPTPSPPPAAPSGN
ncbi:MAG: hypothetical protein LBG78_06410 [Azoarcus sp.]|jgi:hypothetical protein|nr:hypothetical protein [Azoarcus sp.]